MHYFLFLHINLNKFQSYNLKQKWIFCISKNNVASYKQNISNFQTMSTANSTLNMFYLLLKLSSNLMLQKWYFNINIFNTKINIQKILANYKKCILFIFAVKTAIKLATSHFFHILISILQQIFQKRTEAIFMICLSLDHYFLVPELFFGIVH